MAEGRKTKAASEAVRQEYVSVGAALRAARVAKGIEVEDVSASIHVRAVQLRAIEDNNIAALPGMTYAVGFVRSYANFLGLNGAEIVHKFKAEHGHTPAPTQLTFPEPIAESRMPDPIMVGIGAFLAVLVLVLWTVYSNMNSGGGEEAEQIPPAPVATTTADAPPDMSLTQPQEGISVTGALPSSAALPTATLEIPVAKEDQKSELAISKTSVEKAPKKAEVSSSVDDSSDDEAMMEPETAGKPDSDSVISIKRGKSRITLSAIQSSWVQVMDARQSIIYRKVLRPGEKYYVPDQPGLSLVTANAGGIEISVDGQAVQPVGKAGEIVRGIVLDPAALKKQRTRTRN